MLPSGPGGVRRIPLRGAQPSTLSHAVHSTRATLKRGFNPAIADCGLQGTATSPSSTANRRRPAIRAHLLRWRPRPRARRTGSTPRVRSSGAASQLDPSHRSARSSIPQGNDMAEGVGFEPTVQLPVHGISSAAPSATRPPLQAQAQHAPSAGRAPTVMAEGRGFEPPRDSRPYPISSRTPSTGLGHPSGPSYNRSAYTRLALKNSTRRAAHSAPRTPPATTTW